MTTEQKIKDLQKICEDVFGLNGEKISWTIKQIVDTSLAHPDIKNNHDIAQLFLNKFIILIKQDEKFQKLALGNMFLQCMIAMIASNDMMINKIEELINEL